MGNHYSYSDNFELRIYSLAGCSEERKELKMDSCYVW